MNILGKVVLDTHTNFNGDKLSFIDFFNSYVGDIIDFTKIESDEASSVIRKLLLNINKKDSDSVILDKLSAFKKYLIDKSALKMDFMIEEFFGYTLLGNIYFNNKDIF